MARLPGPRNMRLFRASLESSPDMRQMFRDIEMSTDELIAVVLEEVRRDLLRFLKGYTNVYRSGDYRAQFGPLMAGMARPDRNKVEWKDFTKWWDKSRPMHPGGWADITMELRNSYVSEVVKRGPADYELTLDNTAEHAKYVEAMAGMFVVQGVFYPGGYVERSVAKIFAFVSRRFERGPRGGKGKLGPASVTVGNPSGTSITATGV